MLIINSTNKNFIKNNNFLLFVFLSQLISILISYRMKGDRFVRLDNAS